MKQPGVRGYPKISGGSGLHVFVPLAPGRTFVRVRAWVKAVGQRLADAHLELMLSHTVRRGRRGRVTVD